MLDGFSLERPDWSWEDFANFPDIKMKLKRIMITGGAGFVGSSLALRLRSCWPDISITCIDNLHRKGSCLNLARLKKAGMTFIHADVRSPKTFNLPRYDLIIDAAAEPSVMAGMGGSDVKYVVDTNLGGTLNMLEAARKWEASVLFISTSRVYPLEALRNIKLEEGNSRFEICTKQSLPGISVKGLSELFPMLGARTLYGSTKYSSEIMASEYAAQYGLKVMIDRCGVIAGPWQMGRVDQGIVSLWVSAHHYGLPISYIGYKGKQVRDLIHVDDFADLVIAQINAGFNLWDGSIYNVGGGREISLSLLELTELAEKVTGCSLRIKHISATRAGDVPLYITDTRKVRHMFAWKPRKSAAAIVSDTARWIVDNHDMLAKIFCK